jgi:hypothetical protein
MPTIKREPCLCCECAFWSEYKDQYGINWGKCKNGKLAFLQQQKCEEFKVKEGLLKED